METGRHLGFIWAAYGVTGAVSAGLIVRAWLAERRERRILVRLEGGRPEGTGRGGR